MYLKESDAVMAMLLARPQVKAWINGHVHVYTVVRHKGLCMVSLPSTSYTLPGRPLGWVLATARPDGMDLTLKTSSAKHRDHDRKTTLRWRADS